MAIFDWIKTKAVSIFDPHQQARVDALSKGLEHSLVSERNQFSLDRALVKLSALPEDAAPAVEQTYTGFCRRAIAQGPMSENRRASLAWIRQALQLPNEKAQAILEAAAAALLRENIERALLAGECESQASAAISGMAVNVGVILPELVKRHCWKQVQHGLSARFAAMATSGFSDARWAVEVQFAQAVGVSWHDLLQIVLPQAEALIERTLTEAKADDVITDEEEAHIGLLLSRFATRPGFMAYVQHELQDLRFITDIRRGNLPNVGGNSIGLRAGEIVHHHAPVTFAQVKRSRGQAIVVHHPGSAMITDHRLIFNSPSWNVDLNHRKVINLLRIRGGIEVQASGRGSGSYLFGDDTRVAYLIYHVAVGKANQTIVQRQDAASARHIPRDVRQRVWQRYGGRCADCGSTQYIEFDHIVPVARGGSNSDQNVQLLCRRCNLKKSDNI